MKKASRIDHFTFSKYSGWFLTWGLLLLIVGVAAVSASMLTTVISIVLVGFALIVGGCIVVLDTITFWWRHWGGFFLHLLMAALYIGAGVLLIDSPLLGSISLTLMLGIFYVVLGFFRLLYSVSLRSPQWGWSTLNALVSLLIGGLILASWPTSGLFVIGLFVGIDLMFTGLVYIFSAFGTRSIVGSYR